MGRDACRLVVDITDWNVFLPRGAPISGIQRVTLNLLRSLRRLGLPYLIIRHDLLSGYHREVSPSFLDYDFSTPRHPSERGHMHTHNRYTNSYLRSVIASMWFRVKHGLKRFKENPLDCFTTRYVPRDGDMIYLAGRAGTLPSRWRPLPDSKNRRTFASLPRSMISYLSFRRSIMSGWAAGSSVAG